MYILNFWYPVSWITLCFLSPKLHLLFSQTYWHASAVWSQQNLEMNHVAASMQEHCFMINITIHKSLFLRRAKERGEGAKRERESCKAFGDPARKQRRVTLPVWESVDGGEKGASGQETTREREWWKSLQEWRRITAHIHAPSVP